METFELRLSESQIVGLLGSPPNILKFVGSRHDPDGLLCQKLVASGWSLAQAVTETEPVWTRQVVSSVERDCPVLGWDTVEQCTFRYASIIQICPERARNGNPMWICSLDSQSNQKVWVFNEDLDGLLGEMGYAPFFRRLSAEIGVDSARLKEPIQVILRKDSRAFWKIYRVLSEFTDDLI